MNAILSLEPETVMPDDLADTLLVRASRPSDAPAVRWLRRNGHLHGDAQRDCAALPASGSEAFIASAHNVLVVEVDGRVVGATAIDERCGPIAHLRWLCVSPDWHAQQLVARHLAEAATAHARDRGCLKLVVHTALAASQVADLFESLGFVFSRERVLGGAPVVEFYLNFYKSRGHKGRTEDPR